MNYPEFLNRNLLIGSGAIESAHRTVIQQRMKLSGQRWSEVGAKICSILEYLTKVDIGIEYKAFFD